MNFEIRGPVLGCADSCEPILRELPEWFGIESAVRDYLQSIDRLPTWLARSDGAVIGFVSVDSAMPACSAIIVMGVGRLTIHDAAFGQPHEGRLVANLASGGWLRLSLAARRESGLVGHIAFSALELPDAPQVNCWSPAPLAVLPQAQQSGVGSMLVRAGLRLAQLRGAAIAFVLGDPNYYGRFGFARKAALDVESPYDGPAHQAVELHPGALASLRGEVRYPPPFEGQD